MRFAGPIGRNGCLVPLQIEAAGDQFFQYDRVSVGHFAQIDTAREETFISTEVVNFLGMETREIDFVETPFGTVDRGVYRVKIDLLSAEPPHPAPQQQELDNDHRVFEVAILGDAFSLIIGRELLGRTSLEYDGVKGAFVLSAEDAAAR